MFSSGLIGGLISHPDRGAQLGAAADSCKPQIIAPVGAWLAQAIISNAGLRLRQPGSFSSANQSRLPGDPTRSRIGKDVV